ncbi:TetR/AcrR family transcriptional regulator [Dyadobacter psychrotolerans]|uniref:TetR/AcrR family transcriptional regulator n=1 Tax=Dyadobacter psychrotolerans TaxID=2541721 RepID=A0A4R5DMI2_9BACT|nr:TetR/AcrR family transcriptional regulator [Dyadobacter psychrotolerans]TDE15486.1 TetR/AcrR family transcriptional regulator [Dyadobacter psychrotolerans]
MITDTRHAIIESAILVFNEDLSAPLEKIADYAGITRRTLHRYFKDRKELMESCECAVQRACYKTNTLAYNSSDDPVEKLENMFHAGMSCGIKYTFLHKLHSLHDHQHSQNSQHCTDYDMTFTLWREHLLVLQSRKLIHTDLSIEWIQAFFRGIVSASVQSQIPGQPLSDQVIKSAWFSFSKGIGM